MKQRQHRGVSAGTVFMLLLTVLVLVGMGSVLPRLMSTEALMVHSGELQLTVQLSDAIPVLSFSEIPIMSAPEEEAPESDPEEVIPVLESTPVPTPVPTPTPEPGRSITLTIGGSVEIDSNLRKGAYYSDSDKYDFSDMMLLLRDELQSDLTIMSLFNLTDDDKQLSDVNAPESVWDMLAESGVDAVTLSHPHAYDLGIESVRATLNAASARCVATSGVYADIETANQICLVEAKGMQVALLSYTDVISSAGKKLIKRDSAAYTLPQIRSADADIQSVAADVARARDSGADMVIITFNWTDSSVKKSTREQILQQAADAGADVIVNTGWRTLSGVSWLTGKDVSGTIRQTLCIHSIGSLLNGSRKDASVAGMLMQLQVYFDGSNISFERVSYTPTYIWRFKQDGQYLYRIAVSDLPPPDGMSDEQASYMTKAYANVQKALDDSPITIRSK